MTVEEIVETDVVTAQPDTPIATVVAKMAEHDVGSVIVVDESDSPVGIITDRAITLSLEDTPDVSERPVEECMTRDPVTVTEDTTVFDTIRTLRGSEIRRLPVVDDEGRLEGIVTLDDIVVLLGSELNNCTEIVKAQSPRY